MEKDTESSIKIFFSSDYDKFKIMPGNRTVLPKKIKKIKDSIQNGLDILKFCPIIINEKFQIIDGQHRFTVAKEFDKPIHYVMAKNKIHIKQVAEMNNNTDKWTSLNFVECFQKQGNSNYSDLLNFINEKEFTISISASLLMRGNIHDSGIAMIHVKAGTFKIKFKLYVENFIAWMKPLIMYVDNPKSKDYLQAMHVLNESKKFEINKLIVKLKKSGQRIEHQTTKKLYLSHIEEIYNYNNVKRVTIY